MRERNEMILADLLGIRAGQKPQERTLLQRFDLDAVRVDTRQER